MNDVWLGYLCCVISVLGFGSNYIPVKKVDVKDGVFFTLCLASGIFLVGLVQWVVFGFYTFEPIAMLGGVIWAVGNACVPFIVKNCGLGTGQLVWSVTNMSTGWATGTFGLFGKHKDSVEYLTMNVLGVLVVIASLAPFTLMTQADPAASGSNPEDEKRTQLVVIDASPHLEQRAEIQGVESPQGSLQHAGSLKFVYGFVVSLVAGVFMGSNFTPATYLQQIGPPQHSSDSMHYVISHFSGILVATLVYFLVYVAVNGRQSYYGREMILPGLGSGILWGIAQVGWFKANSVLSYVVAFPIIVAVPGVMAAVWGVVLFGENLGARNLSLLALVIVLQSVGVTIVAASKGNS